MQLNNRKELQSCYFEDTDITKIMYGEEVVWEGQKIIDLGSAQSWNIATLYPNLYNKLTSSNFFFSSVSSSSATDSINMRANDTEREWGGFTGGITKSYNATSGILTAYCYTKSEKSNVRMYLVTKPSKLISLGSGTSFNVSSYANYQNFTANNFLISGASSLSWGNYFYPQGYAYSDAGRGTTSVSKSYNSSTGVLRGNITLSSTDTSGVYNWYNGSTSGSITVYLNPKA